MASLPELMRDAPGVADFVKDPNLSHAAAARAVNSVHGCQTSEKSVRRVRRALGWHRNHESLHTPPRSGPPEAVAADEMIGKGKADITSDTVTFHGVVLDENCQDAQDWTPIFKIFRLDPANFEIVDDTVRISTWQQSKRLENGDRDTVQLWSHSARFRRRTDADLPKDITSRWRTNLLEDDFLEDAYGEALENPGTYGMFPADPQLGKKGTEEAVQNWKDGVLGHCGAIRALQRQGMGPEAVHVGWMGDETENVVNSYCVGANELVLTRDLRWVTAGSLEPGAELYTIEETAADSQGRRFAPGTVLHNETRTLPAVRVHFSDGRTLVCTEEHPLLVRRVHKHTPSVWEWVPAQSLMKAGVTYETMSIGQTWQTDDSRDGGWMAGFLDGEGCVSTGTSRVSGQLSFAQKRGAVLDKAVKVLADRGFQFTENHNAQTGVSHVVIKGGHYERLRALGMFQPVRLVPKVQFPRAYSSSGVFDNPTVLSVEHIGDQQIAVMGTSSRTYFANGLASHNTNQPHTIELNRSQQLELDYDLRMWTLREVAKLGIPISASSVISNHGEWTRNDTKEPVTTRADNASTYIARQVQKTFQEIEHFGGPKIDWTIGGGEPHVIVSLSGEPVYMSHGYIEKGKGPSTEVRTKAAIERQILGKTKELIDVRIFLMAHYHHFYGQEFEGRTVFGMPALEATKSSEYMLDQYGVWSPKGMFGALFGRDRDRGWSNVSIF